MRMSLSDKKPSTRLARLGILLCLSLAFSYLEFLLPPLLPVPGIKPGFANIVTVFCACFCGLPDALILSCMRVLLSSLLFGQVTGFLFSLSGALLSYLFLLFFLKVRFSSVSIIGVSMACAAAHNMGQLCASALVLSTSAVFSYAPVLLLGGTAMGALTGCILLVLFSALRRAGFGALHSI